MTLLPIPFAYAQHLTVENFVLYGVQESNGITPNYARGIVVGSVVIHITNPQPVLSIENTDLPQRYECTFTGVDGDDKTLGGKAVVDPTQAQVLLGCKSVYIP